MAPTINQKEIAGLGASLHEINPKLLKSENNGINKLWFQGEEPYFNIFMEVKDTEIISFQIFLRGKSLFWSQEHPNIETDTTNELKVDDVSYYPASKLITPDSIPDQNFIEIVRSILSSRADLPLFKQALEILDKVNP